MKENRQTERSSAHRLTVTHPGVTADSPAHLCGEDSEQKLRKEWP